MAQLLMLATAAAGDCGVLPSQLYAEHVRAFFANRTADEYAAGLAKCSHRVYIAPNGSSVSDGRGGWVRAWNNFLRSAESRKLKWPYNTPIGVVGGDFVAVDVWPCNANSGPRNAKALNYQLDVIGSEWRPQCKAWGLRSQIPLFRGNLRIPERSITANASLADVYAQLTKHGVQLPRLRAFVYSNAHPNLLNARPTGAGWHDRHLIRPPWSQKPPGAILSLRPKKSDKMPREKYYCHSRVVLVLTGIGAAFRLDYHFAAGAAVILEISRAELWYVRYLVPYTHYIPLAAGATNLSDALRWAHENPRQTKAIGIAGALFYKDNLTPNVIAANVCYFMRSAQTQAEGA